MITHAVRNILHYKIEGAELGGTFSMFAIDWNKVFSNMIIFEAW